MIYHRDTRLPGVWGTHISLHLGGCMTNFRLLKYSADSLDSDI